MTTKTIAVTGATGQIGKAIAMQMPELAAAHPELNPAETMEVDGNAFPPVDRALDLCGN